MTSAAPENLDWIDDLEGTEDDEDESWMDSFERELADCE